MTIEFLAAIVAAFFGAGIGLILRKLSGGRLPRWLMPVMAGLGMIGFSVYSEYGWYPRLQAGLPQGAVIAQTYDSPSPLRPWTYVFPLTDRALVVDTRRSLRNDAAPDLVMTQVFQFRRWQETRDIMVVFDCAVPRRVDVTANVRIDDDGNMSGGTWVPLDPNDPVLRTACDGG